MGVLKEIGRKNWILERILDGKLVGTTFIQLLAGNVGRKRKWAMCASFYVYQRVHSLTLSHRRTSPCLLLTFSISHFLCSLSRLFLPNSRLFLLDSSFPTPSIPSSPTSTHNPCLPFSLGSTRTLANFFHLKLFPCRYDVFTSHFLSSDHFFSLRSVSTLADTCPSFHSGLFLSTPALAFQRRFSAPSP